MRESGPLWKSSESGGADGPSWRICVTSAVDFSAPSGSTGLDGAGASSCEPRGLGSDKFLRLRRNEFFIFMPDSEFSGEKSRLFFRRTPARLSHLKCVINRTVQTAPVLVGRLWPCGPPDFFPRASSVRRKESLSGSLSVFCAKRCSDADFRAGFSRKRISRNSVSGFRLLRGRCQLRICGRKFFPPSLRHHRLGGLALLLSRLAFKNGFRFAAREAHAAPASFFPLEPPFRDRFSGCALLFRFRFGAFVSAG